LNPNPVKINVGLLGNHMKPTRKNKDEKKVKKDKDSNLTLYIGLGCGGLALIVMCAGGVIGGVGYQQGWFGSKKDVQVAKAKTDEEKPKPTDNKPKADGGKTNPGGDADKKRATRPPAS
jgi:hypothetical protein